MQPLIGLNTARCIQCKACMAVCPNGCHRIENGEHRFIRETCVACGKCVDSCPVQALEMIGKRMTADEVMRVVRKDQKYYGTDGGMTLSGGEALLQKEFALELMRHCREEGIRVALETNGVHVKETYDAVMPYVDLFRMIIRRQIRRFTNVTLGATTDGSLKISVICMIPERGFWVRCPIIPQVNDNPAHFDAIAQLTKERPTWSVQRFCLTISWEFRKHSV